MKTVIRDNKVINDIGTIPPSGKVKTELTKAAQGMKTARKSIDVALGDNSMGDKDKKLLSKIRIELNNSVSVLSRIVF